ncbi:UNVERIFIED_CONTAM: Pentatricopeptide repeat-containing protein [Sesamum calycinum]|uniref:Pentatricopeptide repeat-containing protein n=1 Tax=Sesamum calycinum TaxID=2727403 RepID=A0AAW2N158_9LAMI
MQLARLASLLDKSLTTDQAKQIHCQIVVNRLNDLEPLLIRQTLNSVARYSPRTAHYVKVILRRMQKPDVFATSFTIRYLSQHGQFREALSVYKQMHSSGLFPNTFAVSSALKACARIVCKIGGLMIHGQAQKCGFCKVVFVQTALVDFYSKIGDMVIARKVFDEIRGKNVVSWNSILAGYVKYGDLAMAQSVFDEMPTKDVISWNSMVSGYARVKDMEQAYELFRRMPQRNAASWNAMITGYIECGKIELARSFFDAMPDRNNVSYITMISAYSKYGSVESAKELYDQMAEKDLLLYNAMIACFAQNNRAKEALQLFDEMLKPNANVQPDKMTLASAISACSQLGDSKYGTWIETYMRDLQKRDLVAYTAMILGYGINGREKEAIELFEEMMDADIIPNLVTFTGILTAYNHAGRLEEAHELIKKMPMQPHAGVWGALLLACSLHNNVELAEVAWKNCCELELDSSGYHSLLANIYASVGRWDDAKRLRRAVEEKGLVKIPGSSWTECFESQQ